MEAAPVVAEAPASSLPYYPLSPWKLGVLSIATFGIYTLWWFYLQWRCFREHSGSEIRPVWRALLSPYFSFLLFNQIMKDNDRLVLRSSVPAASMGFLYLIFILAQWLPGFLSFLYLLHVVPLVIMQGIINQIAGFIKPDAVLDKNFGFASGIVVTIGGMTWLLFLMSLVMTENQVRSGREMKRSEIEYLHSKGYLLPDEQIVYFYSAGLWSIHEDGNFLTNDRVVSYENRGGEEYHDSAHYHEIYAVDVVYSDSWLRDSHITVTTVFGSEIYLVVSTEKNKDRVFIQRLYSEWRKRVPEGEEELMIPPPSEGIYHRPASH